MSRTTTTREPTTISTITHDTVTHDTNTHDNGHRTSLIGEGSPLLGEVTGLRLILGTVGDRPSVLDLDHGELVEATGRLGSVDPILITGDWLVGRRNEQLVSLPLADLGAELVRLGPASAERSDPVGYAPRADGRAWVYVYDESVAILLLDAATGVTLAEMPPPPPDRALSGWVPGSASGPASVISHQAGGIYEAGPDGYRLVTAGRLLVSDDERVLTETCDEFLRCDKQWFDRRSWQPIELSIPTERADSTSFVGGSDWLLLQRYDVGGQSNSLFDVSTGRTFDLDDHIAEFYNFTGSGPAISPDGRWLAFESGISLKIVDLISGEERIFEGLDQITGQMVFTTTEVDYSAVGTR